MQVNKAIMVIGSTLDDGADFELQYDLTNFTPYFLAKAFGPQNCIKTCLK